MQNPSIIPSHTLAVWLLSHIDKILDSIGLSRYKSVEEIIYMAVIVLVSFALGWVVRKVLLAALRKLVALRHTVTGAELLRQHTLSKCTHIIPPLVFLGLVPFAFERGNHFLVIIERIGWIYTMLCFGIGVAAVMNFVFSRYNARENTKNLPIKGVLNIAKGILWLILVIVMVSIAVDKSPAVLLTGLTAFAAALMLIFKDSILGFVAGIQMSQNDMLHVGDWIVVPSTPANGTVLDVSLTAVKVQNWDNTIVTVPPYTLVSTSFQNYRGMKESGARRIATSVNIDITTIKPITPDMVDSLVTKYPILAPFVQKMQAAGTTVIADGGLTPINGTMQTNLGLFRGYLSEYIFNSPDFNTTDQQLLIRILAPSTYGYPLQIYCFTSTTDWDKYEAIQSGLLEHIATVVKDFGLEIYTSGALSVDLTKEQ